MSGSVELGSLGAAGGGAEVIRDLAQVAAAREVIELVDDRLWGVVLEQGQSLHEIDPEVHAPFPFRKRGVVHAAAPDALVGYVNRHRVAATTVWGDLGRASVTAVLDDHESESVSLTKSDCRQGVPGWGKHRAVLTLPVTPDWTHWLSKDGKLVGQSDFADHLEDGASAIREPDAATMLEIAQSFHAKTGVDFKSSARLDNGETRFRYEETTQARAGVAGDLAIPSSLTLGLQPFEGGPTFEVLARFRYRIVNGSLSLGYRLIRPDIARRLAFEAITADIGERTGLPVWLGTPRQ